MTAGSVAKALYDFIYCRFSAPIKISSDRGPHFNNAVIAELTKMCGTEQVLGTPYHSPSQGQVEREIQTMTKMVKKYCNEEQTDWDQYLPALRFARNITINDATGYFAHLLLFGRDLRLPIDTKLVNVGRTSKSVKAHLEELMKKLSVMEELVKQSLQENKQKNERQV